VRLVAPQPDLVEGGGQKVKRRRCGQHAEHGGDEGRADHDRVPHSRLRGAGTAKRTDAACSYIDEAEGKGMLGIYIHNAKNRLGLPDIKGKNPFQNWHIEQNGKKILLSDIYPTYDWVNDNGRDNIGEWIEAAAKKAGR
jgi:hypothetical protein